MSGSKNEETDKVQVAIQIRQAAIEDAPRLRDLRLEALAGHPQAFTSDYGSSSKEEPTVWVERLERYAKSVDEALQIAVAGDDLVGMTGIYRDPRPKIRHAATIWGVYVKPGWRGLGIGDQLVNACLDWAREHEIIFVRLAVITPNVSAIQCYQRCGFSVYGIEPKSLLWEGRYYDELLMGCEIKGDQ
jgi:RimJ/RimL family protein N-acetyltransferase